MSTEIRKIGNSTGLILPKDLVQRLGLSAGDKVVITETPEGFAVSRSTDTLEKGMKIARRAMKTYRNTLRELAK